MANTPVKWVLSPWWGCCFSLLTATKTGEGLVFAALTILSHFSLSVGFSPGVELYLATAGAITSVHYTYVYHIEAGAASPWA